MKSNVLPPSVPGILGNQMEARLNKTGGRCFCDKQSDWYTMWLAITSLFPFAEECFADNAMSVDAHRTAPSQTLY